MTKIRRVVKRLRVFAGHYKLLTFTLIMAVVGGALQLGGLGTASHWVLGTTAAIAAMPLVWGMIETLRDGKFGIDLLAATAIVTSVWLHEYWAAVVIVIMLTGGEALESYAERRAKTELHDLLTHKPTIAHVLRGRKMLDVAAKTIAAGDKLVIMPGEVVPVDAEITEGDTTMDESSLTGESLPVDKSVGSQIMSGAVNGDGAITVRALRAAADSQYEQIIKLVRSASSGQSPFVRLADAYSIPFTVVSFLIAGMAWFVSKDPKRFLEVLVVATPCPLLIGAPIALISGMGRAAKHGIIIKTGSALERLAAAKTFAFDKTGTLTMGQPRVTSVRAYGSFSEASVLSYAAGLEQSSNHVLAAAIFLAAQEGGSGIKKAKQVSELSGHGLAGRVDGKEVLVGRLKLLESRQVSLPKTFKPATFTQTTTFVAVGGELAGAIVFGDTIRANAADMLQRIRRAGVDHIAMVTGDSEASALAVAKQLDVTDVYPDCLPADKLSAVQNLPAWPVVFVGDGVNDAPVLTAADVGIALGARGSTAASESADVVILLDDVSKVAEGFETARRTLSIARQSILIGIVLSLGLMVIFSTGKFKPIYGAAVQEVVDVAVIFNALRALGPREKSAAKSWRRRKNAAAK